MSTAKYTVFFTYASQPHWWTRLLRPGFSHVYMVEFLPQGCIVINPNISSLEIKYYLTGENLPDNLQQLAVPVDIKTNIDHCKKQPVFFRLFSCVEVVKSILGIRNRLIITPNQLYKHIKP